MLKAIIEKLIWLYVLLLPLQTVFIFDEKFINGTKWHYGTGVFYATEILLVFVAVLSLAQLIKSEGLALAGFFTKNNILKKATIACLWLLAFWSGLSILWSAEKSAAFYLWLNLLEGVALFLIILYLKIDKNKLLWPLALTAGLQGLLAGWQFVTQSIAENKWLGIATHEASQLGEIVIENSDGRWLRAYGTFSHPNILGGFCVFGLLATLELSRSAKKQHQLILMIVAMANALGIFFSFSRSAWLAATIATAIIIVRSIKEKNCLTIKTLAAASIVLIFLSVTFSSFVLARSNFANRLEQISLNERSAQIEESLKIFRSSHWLGVGINNYTATLASSYPDLPAYSLQPVHNLYLLILAELGIVGFLAFTFFIIFFLLQGKSRCDRLIWLAPLLIIGLFDHYLWTQYAGIALFWLVLTRME